MWLILLAPLFSAAVVLTVLRREPMLAQVFSITACIVAFLMAVLIFSDRATVPDPLNWMSFKGAANLNIEIGFVTATANAEHPEATSASPTIDPLAKMMLLVVTGVGLLVHIFSLGYMKDDVARARFFGELSLFMFSMIGIVIANNLVMMYIFWELVGLSSYLLVGFWFERPAASAAAKKAFLVNRVGDFGFLLGILFFWGISGGLIDFSPEAHNAIKAFGLESPGMVTAMGLLLFCGCMGKSAMVPLHVWLPDAMEGPTPVSALIHAATMVAAGVYMLCRIYPFLALSPTALTVIAGIGAFTLIFAALIATQQDDIKRILAYSTLSQLGYMVMAVGCAAPSAAMFHLTTHAFFKALLFLGAGSVIYACHHEQDIWKMGGLMKKIPCTFLTFAFGTLALMAIPPFAGYFSKDEILLAAYAKSPLWFFLPGAVTAGLTAFYMARLFIVTFLGSPRDHGAEHAHESPLVMTVPLVILALLALVAGWPTNPFISLNLWDAYEHMLPFPEGIEGGKGVVMMASLGAIAVGLVLASVLYLGKAKDPLYIDWFAKKFYVDWFYDNVLIRLQQGFAWVLAFVDDWILGKFIVRGSAVMTYFSGEILRLFQTGSLQTYAFLFTLGGALILYFTMFPPAFRFPWPY